MQNNYSFIRINWIETNGQLLKPSVVVLVCHQRNTPVFGYIKDIVAVDGKAYLAMLLLFPEIYNSHFHAYEVSFTDKWYICEPKHLQDNQPLFIYQNYSTDYRDINFLPLKYYIIE